MSETEDGEGEDSPRAWEELLEKRMKQLDAQIEAADNAGDKAQSIKLAQKSEAFARLLSDLQRPGLGLGRNPSIVEAMNRVTAAIRDVVHDDVSDEDLIPRLKDARAVMRAEVDQEVAAELEDLRDADSY